MQKENKQAEHYLKKIKWGVIPIATYRGCSVTRLIGGYLILGKRVLTEDEVDDVIDKAGEAIKNSLKN